MDAINGYISLQLRGISTKKRESRGNFFGLIQGFGGGGGFSETFEKTAISADIKTVVLSRWGKGI